MITKCLYASDELIEDSQDIDVVQFIVQLFSEAIGREEDYVITRGNGTTQPTGYYQNAAIPAIAAASATLSFDDIINLEHSLPSRYRRGSSVKFFASNNLIRDMRKVKDTNGRYLWAEPFNAQLPATFHGYAVVEDNNLSENEMYFGDMKKTYWLGDRKKMTVKISQDTETALKSKGSINWVNCWKTLPRAISNLAIV
jgi:HK97 family phage major capsid protein